MEKQILNNESVSLASNEIAYLTDDLSYFDDSAIETHGENELVLQLAESYSQYKYWDILCGENIALDEMQERSNNSVWIVG